MSEAPKRIWAWAWDLPVPSKWNGKNEWAEGAPIFTSSHGNTASAEYIRADIASATIEDLRAEVARLAVPEVRALVAKIEEWEARIDDCEWSANSGLTSDIRKEMRELAAALKGVDNGNP